MGQENRSHIGRRARTNAKRYGNDQQHKNASVMERAHTRRKREKRKRKGEREREREREVYVYINIE